MRKILMWGIYDLFQNGIVRSVLTKNELSDSGIAAVIGAGLVLCVLVAYLLGSLNTALIISKLVYHDDVRRYGSGNAGTTNVMRTYGRNAGIFTFVGDALKGILAILFACVMFGFPSQEYDYIFLITATYMSAFFCIFGHVFPCFSHFRGGKGFATMVGVILVLNPSIFLILFALYVPLILMTHYISLCSIIMAMLYPFILSSFDTAFAPIPRGINVFFALMIGLLITWCHRSNIKRLWEGTERKFYPFGHKNPAPLAAQPPVAQDEDEDEDVDEVHEDATAESEDGSADDN